MITRYDDDARRLAKLYSLQMKKDSAFMYVVKRTFRAASLSAVEPRDFVQHVFTELLSRIRLKKLTFHERSDKDLFNYVFTTLINYLKRDVDKRKRFGYDSFNDEEENQILHKNDEWIWILDALDRVIIRLASVGSLELSDKEKAIWDDLYLCLKPREIAERDKLSADEKGTLNVQRSRFKKKLKEAIDWEDVIEETHFPR